VGRVILLRGECELRKNSIPSGKMFAVEFSYDDTLRFFKRARWEFDFRFESLPEGNRDGNS
jgi:hypothetical protein